MLLVADLHERGVRVVDLSADFRLRDLSVYNATYGEHGAPQLVPDAVYGLPELYRERLRSADLVAGPALPHRGDPRAGAAGPRRPRARRRHRRQDGASPAPAAPPT